ncbi:MAG: hypothetical protein HYR56_34075 [Acidobacteria bacterium]|nr:hypothetical protein [Acidobacteriota bacterium]MBI3422141.1 hypothetical protein [Acidobacteriota bacterium]
MSSVQEIYTQTVRVLPVRERLSLAALILDDITQGQEFAAVRPPLSEEQRQAALAGLMQHAGAVSSGNPRAGDNEQIDADLAREYGKDL